MNLTWEPLIKPPSPQSISGMSADAEKILMAIIKDSIPGSNYRSNFDSTQHFQRNSNISLSPKRNSVNFGGNSTSGKKSVNDEMKKTEGAHRDFAFFQNGDDVFSGMSDFCTNWICDFDKMAFEENSKRREDVLRQNRANKNGFRSNLPGKTITTGTVSYVQQFEEPQLFVLKENPFTKTQCKKSNNFARGVENHRSSSKQRKKDLRQLKIDEYFMPVKKQKIEMGKF